MRDTRTSPPDEEEYRWGCAEDCELCEDPEEIAPCLICAEPKPNKVQCDCWETAKEPEEK